MEAYQTSGSQCTNCGTVQKLRAEAERLGGNHIHLTVHSVLGPHGIHVNEATGEPIRELLAIPNPGSEPVRNNVQNEPLRSNHPSDDTAALTSPVDNSGVLEERQEEEKYGLDDAAEVVRAKVCAAHANAI